jgi:hypothetical protein
MSCIERETLIDGRVSNEPVRIAAMCAPAADLIIESQRSEDAAVEDLELNAACPCRVCKNAKCYRRNGRENCTQAKEVSYLMEQDPFTGCFIDQREEFDCVWDSGEYCPDVTWTLKKEQVEIIGPLQSGEGKNAEHKTR